MDLSIEQVDSVFGVRAASALGLAFGSRIPQIWLNFRQGHTGELSIIMFIANALGCLIRCFTTLSLTQDMLLLFNAFTSLGEFRLYRKNIFEQMMRIGVESIPIVALAAASKSRRVICIASLQVISVVAIARHGVCKAPSAAPVECTAASRRGSRSRPWP